MRKTLLALLASAVALAGCVTEAQREAIGIASLAKASLDQDKACRRVVEANPRYTRVYQKLGVPTAVDALRSPTPTQLADQDTISDEDIATGLEWYAEAQSCGVATIETLGRVDPELEIIYSDQLADNAALLNDVVSKRIQTFGALNARIAVIQQKQRLAGQSWARSLVARLAQQHQQELAEQQEVAGELIADVGSIALAVATRGRASVVRMEHYQSALAQAQAAHARLFQQYPIVHRVRVVQCDGIGRSLRCTLR